MALVEIVDVSLYDLDSERLWGCHIDLPHPDSQVEVYAITIAGWVLGRSHLAVAVEVVNEGDMLSYIPINVSRPDIAVMYPEYPGAGQSGFHVTLGLLETTLECELLVQAVLQDDSRVPLGVIRARRRAMRSHFQPRLQPLMVTSVGRTGSTWLMQLLSEHPQVVVYRDYPYELRTAKYWMHMLKVVSEPANHFLSADPENFHESMSYIGHNPFYSGSVAEHPQLGRWFGRIHVEQLATFCQFSIEECYKQVADSQRQFEPVYFAEKHVPDRIPGLIWELYAQAREVILVRDFRDMVCSMLAYNAKRGYNSFGREEVNSDEEFVRRVYQTQLVPLVRSWKSRSKKVHLLRYEDLILHPARTLSFLLEYLDLDHSISTVEGMIQRASKERPGMEQHRTSPDLDRSIGRWRRDLAPSLQVIGQEVFGDALEAFGYTEQ